MMKIIIISFTILTISFQAILFLISFKKAKLGQALIRTGAGDIIISFKSMFAFPIIHHFEIMNITNKTIKSTLESLVNKENLTIDIDVSFIIRVNHTTDTIKKVAQTIGAKRASNLDYLKELFDVRFNEAIKSTVRNYNFIELDNRIKTGKRIKEEIGTDLNGFIIEECIINKLEQIHN